MSFVSLIVQDGSQVQVEETLLLQTSKLFQTLRGITPTLQTLNISFPQANVQAVITDLQTTPLDLTQVSEDDLEVRALIAEHLMVDDLLALYSDHMRSLLDKHSVHDLDQMSITASTWKLQIITLLINDKIMYTDNQTLSTLITNSQSIFLNIFKSELEKRLADQHPRVVDNYLSVHPSFVRLHAQEWIPRLSLDELVELRNASPLSDLYNSEINKRLPSVDFSDLIRLNFSNEVLRRLPDLPLDQLVEAGLPETDDKARSLFPEHTIETLQDLSLRTDLARFTQDIQTVIKSKLPSVNLDFLQHLIRLGNALQSMYVSELTTRLPSIALETLKIFSQSERSETLLSLYESEVQKRLQTMTMAELNTYQPWFVQSVELECRSRMPTLSVGSLSFLSQAHPNLTAQFLSEINNRVAMCNSSSQFMNLLGGAWISEVGSALKYRSVQEIRALLTGYPEIDEPLKACIRKVVTPIHDSMFTDFPNVTRVQCFDMNLEMLDKVKVWPLKHLDLECSLSVDDAFLEVLVNTLPSLKSLNLSATSITWKGVRTLAGKMPFLQDLDISANCLVERSCHCELSALTRENFPSLTRLSVCRNSLSQKQIEYLLTNIHPLFQLIVV